MKINVESKHSPGDWITFRGNRYHILGVKVYI